MKGKGSPRRFSHSPRSASPFPCQAVWSPLMLPWRLGYSLLPYERKYDEEKRTDELDGTDVYRRSLCHGVRDALSHRGADLKGNRRAAKSEYDFQGLL